MPETTTERLLRLKSIVAIPPIIAAALYAYFLRTYSSKRRAAKSRSQSAAVLNSQPSASSLSGKPRVGVNMRFVHQMQKLLPILVPGGSTRRL